MARSGELTISAASSLTNAFKAIGAAYGARHPHDKLTFNFAASDVLVTQIVNGAPVDVIASADDVAMERGLAQGALMAASRRNFARNKVVVVVPTDATVAPSVLSDLAGPHFVRLATGNPVSVPIGRYTKIALGKSGLWTVLEPKFVFGQNVRQVLDYVARGAVDAGFVYATDAVLLADQVRIALEVPLDAPPVYPIAAVAKSRNLVQAQRFIDFVLSPAGQSIMARHGFAAP